MVVLNLWYSGPSAAAEAAYKPFFDLEPVMQICAPTPYSHINDCNDAVCAKGLRKPSYCVGLDESELGDLEKVWEQWVEWSAREGAGQSVVLTECYGFEKAREVEDESTAYAWRGTGVYV
jgi:hypothetical protein